MGYNNIKKEEILKYLSVFVIKDENLLEELCNGDKELSMVKKELEGLTDEFDKMFYCSPEELEKQIKEEYQEEAYKEGLSDGINQGKTEATIELAKNMLNKNMKIQDIIDITGLSKEELSKIEF